MASFPVDPRPHAPRGFDVIPHKPNASPLWLYVYLGTCMDAFNDDTTIVVFSPVVSSHQGGFQPMAEAHRDYFMHDHNVHTMEDPRADMGDLPIPHSKVQMNIDEEVQSPIYRPDLTCSSSDDEDLVEIEGPSCPSLARLDVARAQSDLAQCGPALLGLSTFHRPRPCSMAIFSAEPARWPNWPTVLSQPTGPSKEMRDEIRAP
ncbi:hypothetical protein HU200_038199 [Digitaria exilis]|uniref:Uncharacterized protein n=1 Tax=Digitaria exilis TaxID=1010633 RepID=A0A835BC24_9POAL|nr:hypothetical protein HU200_038199 [Digitaria exilis]